jgi:dTDP-4-dehydrorhamnose reductase
MRWLITGATGLFGPYLIEAAGVKGTVIPSARSGGDHPCDLTDRESVARLLDAAEPDMVVHAAGLTDVDDCERDAAAAFAANRDTAAAIAGALPAEARLVHISTDQVYRDSEGPHSEADTGPVNVYGQSKLAGEEAALTHSRTLVLRTNFFGPSRTPGRRSLSDFVVDSLSAGRSITLFDDILFSALHMATLAALVVEMAVSDASGVYNAGSRTGMSKAEFGLAVARHLSLPTDRASVGRSDCLPGRARRPHDLRLDVSRLEEARGRAMPTLEEEIGKL